MTHCLVDPAAVTHRKQFSRVYHTLATQQKLVLMNTADSTEQTMYSWVRKTVNWKECGFKRGVFHLKVWGHYFIWQLSVATICWPACSINAAHSGTACTFSEVEARSNKQQFWDKIGTSTMPTSAWIHCGTQLQQLVTASGMNGTSDLP
jgi:hypothetical protein